MTELRKLWALPSALLLLAGCNEAGPVAPETPAPAGAVELLSCRAEVRSGEVTCAGSEAGLEGGALGAIIGGQGVYVLLTSTNVSYDEASQVFSAVVSVHNLGNQVIGSSDGVTPHANGVRVFFVSDPVTTQGTGDVSVRNADGTADFTANGQPYFQYSQALGPGRTSLPKTWEWDVPSTVESFSFLVGVAAEVADEAALAPIGIDFIAETVAADSLHSCAIDATGQAWCWGLQYQGRLGNGATDSVNVATPVQVEQGSLRFVSIATMLSHTCALTDTGDAYCWGNGGSGRLGNGASSSSGVPVKVAGGHKFKQISRGRQFTCALSVEGKAYCWGYNGNGQLGDGTTTSHNQPVAVDTDLTFKMIAAGGYHTCGLTAEGDTYCWGSSTYGKLGIGDTTGNVLEPNKVLGGHKFAKIYAGRHTVCGLTADGEAWCWGNNGNGQVGDGDTVVVKVPAKVVTTERFVSLSPSTYHTCGVTYDGRGFCWGSNGRGKMGIGTTTGTVNPEPLQVVNITNFAHISAGNDHSCGVTTDGAVYCWGNAAGGRRGNGSTSGSSGTPSLVQTIGPVAFLDGAPAGCAEEGEGCFPRKSFDDHVFLASGRGAGYFVLRLS